MNDDAAEGEGEPTMIQQISFGFSSIHPWKLKRIMRKIPHKKIVAETLIGLISLKSHRILKSPQLLLLSSSFSLIYSGEHETLSSSTKFENFSDASIWAPPRAIK